MNSRHCCAALLAGLLLILGAQASADPGRLPAQRLAKLGQRWQGHPDAQLIRAAVRTGGEIDFVKTPFRLAGNVHREGADLVVRIDTLAAREHVHGWGPFTIVRLSTKAKSQGTLGKTVAGIMEGVSDLAAADPALRRVRIVAPSIVNKRLAATLRHLGFTDSSFRSKQLVIGHKQPLELTIPLPPGQ